MDYKIAIVNSSSFGKIFPEHIERLKKIGPVDFFRVDNDIPGKELAELLQGYNLIISSVTPFFTEEFFDNKDETLLISRHGIGYNNVDIQAAEKHDTIVSIVSALVERDAVAENNITNLLALMRMTVSSSQRVRQDLWKERAQFVGHTLYNKTVGVIGLGNIGSCVAETLRNGFRCQVLAYDPYKTELDMQAHGAIKVDLDELLTRSDVICFCANLTEDNYHMISREEVAKMKDGVYISNTARGALLDEQAIVEGLKTKKIAGIATDVLEAEPGDSHHPYLAFDNVIITPHTSAYTMECLEQMGLKCVQDVEDVVAGKLPGRCVQAKSKYVNKC